MDRHVLILMQFRDKWLLSSYLGRGLVDMYYEASPPVADYLRQHPTARTTVRYALIPLTGVAYLSLHVHPLIILTCLTLLALALTFAFRRWIRKHLLDTRAFINRRRQHTDTDCMSNRRGRRENFSEIREGREER